MILVWDSGILYENAVITFNSVVLKVGGIVPLEVILRGKKANKPKGAIGGERNTKGEKTLNH